MMRIRSFISFLSFGCQTCGFGGQGIILSAVLLGTAAVTRGGLYAVQTQSYGSEARGGQCQAELIIDKAPINSPVAEKKNLMVAMFQTAYEKYIPTLADDGVLVIEGGFIGTVDMGVGVDMGVLMGVELIAVAVFVAVGMGVLMGVLEGNGVEDHQERSQDHQPKAQEKTPVGPLPQKDDAKHDA